MNTLINWHNLFIAYFHFLRVVINNIFIGRPCVGSFRGGIPIRLITLCDYYEAIKCKLLFDSVARLALSQVLLDCLPIEAHAILVGCSRERQRGGEGGREVCCSLPHQIWIIMAFDESVDGNCKGPISPRAIPPCSAIMHLPFAHSHYTHACMHEMKMFLYSDDRKIAQGCGELKNSCCYPHLLCCVSAVSRSPPDAPQRMPLCTHLKQFAFMQITIIIY